MRFSLRSNSEKRGGKYPNKDAQIHPPIGSRCIEAGMGARLIIESLGAAKSVGQGNQPDRRVQPKLFEMVAQISGVDRAERPIAHPGELPTNHVPQLRPSPQPSVHAGQFVIDQRLDWRAARLRPRSGSMGTTPAGSGW